MIANGTKLFHIRSGREWWLEVYFDREHAHAQLGLAPAGVTSDGGTTVLA